MIITWVVLAAIYCAVLLHYRESEHRDVPPVLPVATPLRHAAAPTKPKPYNPWFALWLEVGAQVAHALVWIVAIKAFEDHTTCRDDDY